MGNFFSSKDKPDPKMHFEFKIDPNRSSHSDYVISDVYSNKSTKNLISNDKNIPIIDEYKVDQIYPKELVEIFVLLEYTHLKRNYLSYNRLTNAILMQEDNYIFTINVDKEICEYFQKLKNYIEMLKKYQDFDEFKQKWENKEYELRSFKVELEPYYCSVDFYYPYFKEINISR